MHDSAELVVIASPSGVRRLARSPDTSPALPLSGAMLHLVGTPARSQGCRSPSPRAFASVDPGSGGSTGRATKALFRSSLSATPTTPRPTSERLLFVEKGHVAPPTRASYRRISAASSYTSMDTLFPIPSGGFICARAGSLARRSASLLNKARVITRTPSRSMSIVNPPLPLDPGRRALGGVGSQLLGGGLDAVGGSALERLHSYEHCRPLLSSAPKARAIVKCCGSRPDRNQAATLSSVVVVSSSVTRMPSLNCAPASTSATSSWPLKRRQRSCAASSSL